LVGSNPKIWQAHKKMIVWEDVKEKKKEHNMKQNNVKIDKLGI
jgi:hypothetical protein